MTTIASFWIRPDLVVTCFTRLNRLTAPRDGGPLFVVREFDSRIIRARHTADENGVLSEQAKRAGIRSVILNMQLKLEHGTKEEIQILKSVGVLGRRAPSCSLLCGQDMALMLEAFGRKNIANDLRQALVRPDSIREFDPSKVVREEDIEAEEKRWIETQRLLGRPVDVKPASSSSSLNPNAVMGGAAGGGKGRRPKANPLTGKAGRARLQQLLAKGTIDSDEEEENEYIKAHMFTDAGPATPAAQPATNAGSAPSQNDIIDAEFARRQAEFRRMKEQGVPIPQTGVGRGNYKRARYDLGGGGSSSSGSSHFNYTNGSSAGGHYLASGGYISNISQLPPYHSNASRYSASNNIELDMVDAGGLVSNVELGGGFDSALLIPIRTA